MTKTKRMRATYIMARLINSRPEGESFTRFADRIGIPRELTVKKLCEKNDVVTGWLYRVCKAFGYQIIAYNPNPPAGLEKMYVIGEEKRPIVPKEHKGYYHAKKDKYTNEIFRVPRTYKKKQKSKKVG